MGGLGSDDEEIDMATTALRSAGYPDDGLDAITWGQVEEDLFTALQDAVSTQGLLGLINHGERISTGWSQVLGIFGAPSARSSRTAVIRPASVRLVEPARCFC